MLIHRTRATRYWQLSRENRRAFPALFAGFASLFDFAVALAPRVSIASLLDSDAEGLASDCDAVGNDLWRALGVVQTDPNSPPRRING